MNLTFSQQLAAEIRRRNQIPEIVESLWKPNSGPQSAAYHCLADELFYGGSAGGGKTDLLVGLAVTAHRNSAIFRREFSQFRGSEGLIQRSRQIIGEFGRLNEALFFWRDLPGDRSLEFAAVKDETDKFKYKGRAHDLKAFDEVTEILESQYRFLISWNRTTIVGQRCRIVCASNPPTNTEGRWVIRYWAAWLDEHHPKPAVPGELRWYVVLDGKDVEVPTNDPIEHKMEGRGIEIIKPKSRTFIAASVQDNPYLMATDYVDRLQSTPEPLRSQLLYGDFTLSQEDDVWQVIPTAWIRAAQARWTPKRPDVKLSALGCDPSRGGADQTINAKRYGHWIAQLKKYPGKSVPDGPHVAGLVIMDLDDPSEDLVNIDVGGIGSSPYDFLKDKKIKVRPLNGSEASNEKDKSGKLGFFNKRAEWHWKMREALDPASKMNIALPPDPELLADLSAPKWKLTARGVQVESKDEIKERLGRSPDCGEAVMYSFVPPPPGLIIGRLAGT